MFPRGLPQFSAPTEVLLSEEPEIVSTPASAEGRKMTPAGNDPSDPIELEVAPTKAPDPALPPTGPPAKQRDRLERAKDAASIVQAILTSIALVVGGIWFMVQRQDKPRIKIEHRISHHRISMEKQLLVVDVVLSNVGLVKADIDCGKIKLYEIVPNPQALSNAEGSCNVSKRFLEQGESDPIHQEYPVRGDTRTVRVYSWLKNPKGGDDAGWDLTSVYDLIDPPKGDATRNASATSSVKSQ